MRTIKGLVSRGRDGLVRFGLGSCQTLQLELVPQRMHGSVILRRTGAIDAPEEPYDGSR